MFNISNRLKPGNCNLFFKKRQGICMVVDGDLTVIHGDFMVIDGDFMVIHFL